jgi:hypothetical protein
MLFNSVCLVIEGKLLFIQMIDGHPRDVNRAAGALPMDDECAEFGGRCSAAPTHTYFLLPLIGTSGESRGTAEGQSGGRLRSLLMNHGLLSISRNNVA